MYSIYTILIALLVAAISLYLRRPGKQPIVLLAGPLSSGKSSLFQLLAHNSHAKTYTSIAPNEAQVSIAGSRCTLIDTPGSNKLFHIANRFKPTHILYVLDSATIAKNSAQVVQSLVQTLQYAKTAKVEKLLICGNKSDYFTAQSASKIKEILRDGLEDVKKSKSTGLSEDDIDMDEDIDIHDIQVLVGSVEKGEISEWKEWLESSL